MIAYYSKKLNSAQINYTTTKKDLLAAVITFKEYSKMLSGAVFLLYTDHKNLTFRTFSIRQVLRWRLYLDQFDYNLCYIEGKLIVLADCFSRLSRMDKPYVGDRAQQAKGVTTIDFKSIEVPKDNEEIMGGETFRIDTYTTTNERYYSTFVEIPELM